MELCYGDHGSGVEHAGAATGMAFDMACGRVLKDLPGKDL
jgi:hypothetical protein